MTDATEAGSRWFLDTQQQRLFQIYNYYRLAVTLLLFLLTLLEFFEFGSSYAGLQYYQTSLAAYFALNLFTAFLIMARTRLRSYHVVLSMIADIIILHALLLLSTGVTNGLANLIVVAVGAGNILVPGRLGYMLAALATLATLAVAGLGLSTDDVDSAVRAGILGIVYFLAAAALQSLTRRMFRSEALASSTAESLHELEKINRQIIQRMRTGILLVNRHGDIRLSNMASEELLFGIKPTAYDSNNKKHPTALPAELRESLEQWLQDPRIRPRPFQAHSSSRLVQANFTRLDRERVDPILVFLEDMSKVTQQAQQMKLASLGRLTAGIAHEIRNPLGAISHASQLMAESTEISNPDRKMLDIIQRHCRRVNGIVENVLDLSRRRPADADALELEPWLRDFVRDYQQIRTASGAQPAEIEILIDQAPEFARFDRSQIEQVLTNLMDNGLRYSEANTGRARLNLRLGRTSEGERALLDICDDGPGIAPEHRDSIFEPFFTTDQRGTGLGLYLARELCENNQANLALLDCEGPGSCFRLTFAHFERMI